MTANSKAFILGLTGGIACGKSTVAARLAELGAIRVDADAITHELLGEVPPNVAMLGALAKATDCVSLDSLRKAVQMKIPGKAGEMNAETCAAAYRNA